jgi:hypothetical protein
LSPTQLSPQLGQAISYAAGPRGGWWNGPLNLLYRPHALHFTEAVSLAPLRSQGVFLFAVSLSFILLFC